MKCLVILLSMLQLFGSQQNEPPQVNITDPLNGSIVDDKQVRISFEIISAAPLESVKIAVDGRPVQLLTYEAKIGENKATVDLPEKNCIISITAKNRFGESAPATVNLIRSGNIFKPTLYVLAIGVSAYNNPDLQLQFPAKDASDFAQAMLRQAGLLYERVELKLLADKSATEVSVRDGFTWLQTQTTNRDVAMLFIAGHGINSPSGDFYFMPVNADIERINATCVSYTEIKKTISNVPGKLLVFMDACHSGNVLGDQTKRSTSISDAAKEIASASNAPVVYTSSTGAQYSLESPEWNNGAFTKALIEGLHGKADLNGNKMVTIKSLDYYIAQRVKELTKGKQAPTTIIPQSVADFPIAVVTEMPVAETKTQVITPAKMPVSETKTKSKTSAERDIKAIAAGHDLVVDGKKVFVNGLELKPKEVQGVMVNPDALRLYNKSFSRNRKGNICTIAGTGLAVGGVFVLVNQPFAYNDYYTSVPFSTNESSNSVVENSYYRYNTDRDSVIGGICLAVGSAALIAGITFKITSSIPVKKSVDMYNNSRTSMELKFGATGNGVRLALHF